MQRTQWVCESCENLMFHVVIFFFSFLCLFPLARGGKKCAVDSEVHYQK